MKKYLRFFLSITIAAGLLFSCQHELFFDVQPAEGFLQSSTGDCLPKTIGGTYIAAQRTGDTNFIEVSVRVTRSGEYTVTSDTVNGYSFKATGNFPDTGLLKVKMFCSGTPRIAGTDHFIVRFSNSTCDITVTVITGIEGPLQPAVFTLQGAPDTCFPISIAGNYIKDVSLNGQDTIIVTLMVSAAGSYDIATNTVNGYKFAGSGVVNTGLQMVSLRGLGTPLQTGKDVFTVTAGSSACSFSITITNPVIVTGTDYFPITNNSYWTYDDLFNRGDTVKRIFTDSAVNNGNLYHIMHEYDQYGGDTSFMFRKAANDYIQYGPVDILTTALKYIPNVFGEIKFLKQNLASGDTWMSEEYVGNLFSGQPVYLQYNFICPESNTAITINGNSFINVYHLVILPQLRSSQNYPFNSTGEEIDLYYAKGIGLVYMKATNMGFIKRELALRYWKVY